MTAIFTWSWTAGTGKVPFARHSREPEEGWVRRTLEHYRQLGFTYLRDGGDRWGVGKRARELAPQYGIRYRTPLSPLCKAGHYGGFIGTRFENLREYASLVEKAREQGADFIKIMISGLMDFDQAGVLTEEGLPPEEIRELIHIAHEEGFPVMAHANGARTVEAAAQAGVDSVEHGAYLDMDALQAMQEAGTVWIPTLSTIGNLRGTGRFREAAVEEILESAMGKRIPVCRSGRPAGPRHRCRGLGGAPREPDGNPPAGTGPGVAWNGAGGCRCPKNRKYLLIEEAEIRFLKFFLPSCTF